MQPEETRCPTISMFLILPVLVLAFYLAFLPHKDYPYILHIDEWVHMATAEAVLEAGSVSYSDPFFGETTETLGSNLEIGYQVFWGLFQRISGISWLTIFRFFPAIVFLITILCIYILAQRMGFGWQGAFFVALIPTTVGILGPAFLVPVAMGILFVSLSLFVVFHLRCLWSYIILFIFTCFLVAIHAPSAICLILILLPFIFLNLKGDFKHGLFIFLALLMPFLVPFPWIFKMLLPTAKELLTQQAVPEYVDFPRVIKSFGYVPTALCLLGTLALVFKGGKKNLGLVLGLVVVLLMLVVFFTFHYGIAIMYERGLMFMMLMMGIVAGAGLLVIKEIPLPERFESALSSGGKLLRRYLGWGLCLVLVGIVLWVAIPDRQDIPYYHMIDDEDYQAYIWIKENVSEDYTKAILDPWKATPFAAVTGKYVYTRIHAFPTESDEIARQFLIEGCTDTDFLRENEISIVYTELECRNPDLDEVRDNVYILRQ